MPCLIIGRATSDDNIRSKPIHPQVLLHTFLKIMHGCCRQQHYGKSIRKCYLKNRDREKRTTACFSCPYGTSYIVHKTDGSFTLSPDLLPSVQLFIVLSFSFLCFSPSAPNTILQTCHYCTCTQKTISTHGNNWHKLVYGIKAERKVNNRLQTILLYYHVNGRKLMLC